jgi:hypothetical protein
MRKLLIVLAASSVLMAALSAAASEPSQRYAMAGPPGRTGGPGNPAKILPPEPKKNHSLGTSSPSGWGGPNPGYHHR